MESFFTRYRNSAILALVLLAQVLGLAVQVKRPIDPDNPDGGSVRLLRSWVVGAITPLEKVLVSSSRFVRRTWHDYINVVGLRSENRELHEQNEKLHLELARQADSANQAQRLQVLLDFKQRFVSNTVAAQVVGSSGSELSHVIYIDKGSRAGIRPGMAVITPDGIVGKVRDVYRFSAQVLMINDPSSGVGAILETSRLHGVAKGTSAGEVVLAHLMSDEKVEAGERLVTSGGDRIFPKGLPVGTVSQVSPGPELFLNVRIKPAANLGRLEEVLVITETQGAQTESTETETPARASDILAERLPSVPKKPAEQSAAPKPGVKIPPAQSASSGTAATTLPKPKATAATGAAPLTPAAGATVKPGGTQPRTAPQPSGESAPAGTAPSGAAPALAPAQTKRQPGTAKAAPKLQPPADTSAPNQQPATSTPPPANPEAKPPAAAPATEGAGQPPPSKPEVRR